MDPDRLTPTDPPTIDDAAIAALVRDVVDDWHLPPRRLDDVTWRDRVGRGRAGGGGSGVRWTRRLLGAAAVAVVATVSLSFAAVWLTAPRGDQGVVGASDSPSPSSGSTPGASVNPSASAVPTNSPLPKLVRNGDLPTPSRVMVRVAERYHIVDLATGTLGPQSLQANIGPATVLARPGGGWVCICGVGYSSQAVHLRVVTVDPDGTTPDGPASNGVSSAPILRDIQGTFDPSQPVAYQPLTADAHVTTTPDGRYALVGWIYRDGAAGWVLGVDVLDLETLEVTSRQEIQLDEPVIQGSRGRIRTAPVASVSTDGTTILLSSFWYVDQAYTATPTAGTDHWTGLFVDGVIGVGKARPGLIPAGSTSGPDCYEFDAGAIDKGYYYRLCRTPLERFEVTRVGVDGAILDTTELPRDENAQGAMLTIATTDALFLWNPVGRTITRYDLETAAVTTGEGATAVAPDGLADQLAALGRRLGRFIAPSALAKNLVEQGIVVSPDGRRIYALGISGVDGADGSGASTGIDVFDADSLESLAHWAPTAPYLSLAINADGTAVYAGAPGGIAPDGSGSPDNGASITVFDSASGEVRLLAGQIGQPGTHDLTFTEPVLR